MANRRQQAVLRWRRRVPAQLYGSSTSTASSDWVVAWGKRPVRPATPLVDPVRASAEARRVASRRRLDIAVISPLATPEYVAALVSTGYEGVPRESTDERRHRTQIATRVNQMLVGKINNVGDMTLAANSSATILKDQRLSASSTLQFDPLTANAAAELFGGTMYITAANRRAGSFTITHSNAASTDRTFRYAILG